MGNFEAIAGKKPNAWSPYAVRPIQSHGSSPCQPIPVPSFRTHRKYEVKIVTPLGDIETHERGFLLAREICNEQIHAASFPLGQSSLRQLNQILEFVRGLNLRLGAIEDALNDWFLGVA
jgi:hypothetical protein